MIELRSDTFTVPTDRMRSAMAGACVGDDVYGEDPTVNRLEELATHLLGKDAACYMPSGTMANLASILAHCQHGTKVIVGDDTDIFKFEAGGAAVCGGLVYAPVPNEPDGTLCQAALDAQFSEDYADPQLAPPALICLENTHCGRSGAVLPLDYLAETRAYAARRSVPLHMDGARIFNAAIALDVPPARIAAYADSVQFCLSKGLGAPVGSMVTGTVDFITRVRRYRKMLGGGMRQAGVIAAAGVVALEEMVGRLADDHANARRLAAGLARLPGIVVDREDVQTNIVIFRLANPAVTPEAFIADLQAHGVAIGELGPGRLRAVTHHGIEAADIDRSLSIAADVLSARSTI